ncbi:cupin domain-containing protein [Burkholderia sp. PU8-34]
MIVNTNNTEHYTWREVCDGWILSKSPDLLVIEERMPAGTNERRHFHSKAKQFFYVLSGDLTMEIEGKIHVVPPMSGIEIAPGKLHQARNDSGADVRFLVMSTPSTRGDRTDIDG